MAVSFFTPVNTHQLRSTLFLPSDGLVGTTLALVVKMSELLWSDQRKTPNWDQFKCVLRRITNPEELQTSRTDQLVWIKICYPALAAITALVAYRYGWAKAAMLLGATILPKVMNRCLGGPLRQEKWDARSDQIHERLTQCEGETKDRAEACARIYFHSQNRSLRGKDSSELVSCIISKRIKIDDGDEMLDLQIRLYLHNGDVTNATSD